jgi:hypothetical protein
LYCRADYLLTNSSAYRVYLVEKKSILGSKVTLISIGVNPDLFNLEGQGPGLLLELSLNGKLIVTYSSATGLDNGNPLVQNDFVARISRASKSGVIFGFENFYFFQSANKVKDD